MVLDQSNVASLSLFHTFASLQCFSPSIYSNMVLKPKILVPLRSQTAATSLLNLPNISDNAQKISRLNAPSFNGLVVAWKA